MHAEPYQFRPEERPAFAGSPFAPSHPMIRRLGYFLVALLVGCTASLGNALVTTNASVIAGSMGLYAQEAAWFSAMYVAFNACANLLLVKARAQFGIPAITCGLLSLYILVGLLQFIVPGFGSMIVLRAVNGMTAAALTTFTIYNLLQVFSGKAKPLALLVGISLIQFGSPLARLVPLEILAPHNWRGLHLIEIALPLLTLTAALLLPIPPSERSKAYQPLDFVSIGLIMPAVVLVCGVLAQGRNMWWTDTPWLGWMLVAAVPLLAVAFIIESRRQKPLLRPEWFRNGDILRFAAMALVLRLALAEQTYGSVGLLTSSGLTNDQLHLLFGFVVLAMVLGVIVAVVTVSIARLPYQVMVAALVIAGGAFLDSFATNLTRPEQLYLSQAMIGFGTILFIGPAILYGFTKMLEKGGDYLVSFLVLFSTTQNIGGLLGSTLLSSYQYHQMKYHAATLAERLVGSDPQVAARVAAGGIGQLNQALTREANILAFNDTFRFVGVLALAAALYIGIHIIIKSLKLRRKQMEIPL